jgi:hypothetical protein
MGQTASGLHTHRMLAGIQQILSGKIENIPDASGDGLQQKGTQPLRKMMPVLVIPEDLAPLSIPRPMI